MIECTGFPEPIAGALQAAGKYGRVIILGSTRGETKVNFYRDVHKKALKIIGAHASSVPEVDSHPGHWPSSEEARLFLSMIQRGMIDVDDIASEKRSYREYQEIYARILGWDADYRTTIIDWN